MLLNEAVCRANIERMARKAARAGTLLRPHAKTHQSAAVAAWCREAGVTAITTSSVAMARYFADHGWQDISISFPVNWRELGAIAELARRVQLGLLASNEGAARFLAEHLRQAADIWLEVETGDGRSGIRWDQPERLDEMRSVIEAAPHLRLRGLLTHAGHTYDAADAAGAAAVWAESLARLRAAREALRARGCGPLELSPGDTPGCMAAADFDGVDEIRPGNFVFHDLMMRQIGVCGEEDMALGVACPVVDRQPDRRQWVIYGGAVHIARDALREDGQMHFGEVAPFDAERGWGEAIPGARLVHLSQEHGLVQTDAAHFDRFQLGDLLVVRPVHACITAHHLRGYRTLCGQWLAMMDGPREA
ncbi:MAG: alanine racemase [Anaerolineaceae bacterium]|nr:alanine racemase [Anaerolineaceae bacterium]